MKIHFHLFKLFSSCLFFFYILPSCNESTTTKTAQPPLAQKVVNITGGNTSSGMLTMTDINGHNARNILVNRGQKILWVLHTNTIVGKVDTIIQKDISNNYNIFLSPPMNVGGSKNWTVTIDRNTDNPYEWYNIAWTDTAGNHHTYDPLIQVNPGITTDTTAFNSNDIKTRKLGGVSAISCILSPN